MNKKHIPELMHNSAALTKINGKGKGVLLIHGFKGSPFEMKELGEHLYEKGFSISIPRLPGHGTDIMDMLRSTDRDWFTEAREALVELKSRCGEVSIVGQSMGGILGLILAGEFTVKKLALLSVPRAIREKSIYLTPLIGLFVPFIKQEDMTKGLASEEARRVHECYSSGIPVRQSWYLHRLIRRGMAALPRIDTEVLLMQSRNDNVIPRNSMDYIYNTIPTVKKERVYLEKSDHAISLDLEKKLVAKQVAAFLSR